MTSPAAPRSQHPTDILIRELIATHRPATGGDVAAIIERIATADFNPQVVRVPVRFRGETAAGVALRAREPSLRLHLHKRIRERQWSQGTTESEYLGDLRRVPRSPRARVVVYRRRGGDVALVFVPTSVIVPPDRLAEESLPWLAVFYAADRGTLTSGYQFSALDQLATSEELLWLK